MAVVENLKILGQESPAATTVTDLYVVPGGKMTMVSQVIVCNRNASAIKYRVSVAIAGAADAVTQYIFYDYDLSPHDTDIQTVSLTLEATDEIRVYSDTANVNFHAYGDEITL